jgi:hypothetical protein
LVSGTSAEKARGLKQKASSKNGRRNEFISGAAA